MNTTDTFEFVCPRCGKNVKARMPQAAGTYRITCPYCGESNRMQLPGISAEPEVTAEPVAEPTPAPAPQQRPAAPAAPLNVPKGDLNPARAMHRYPIQMPAAPGFKPKAAPVQPAAQPAAPARPAAPVQPSTPRPVAPAPAPVQPAPQVQPEPAPQPQPEPAPEPTPEAFHPAPEPIERPIPQPAPQPVQQPVVNVPLQSETTPLTGAIGNSRIGKLVQLGRISNTPYPLKEGANIIGRYDETNPGDINIKGDNTMSRRSVELNVQVNPAGIRYAVRVLKAANPVLLNERPLDPAFDRPFMNIGDILQLGQTKFRLDPA